METRQQKDISHLDWKGKSKTVSILDHTDDMIFYIENYEKSTHISKNNRS